MDQLHCPVCKQVIAEDDFYEDVGETECSHCGARASQSMFGTLCPLMEVDKDLWQTIPRGCNVYGHKGDTTLVAYMRDGKAAIKFLLLALFLLAFTIILFYMSLIGFYAQMVGPVPEWFLLPAQRSRVGDPDIALWACFVCLVMSFVLGFISMIALYTGLMAVSGRVKLHVGITEAKLVAGVWPVRQKRQFKLQDVSEVMLIELSSDLLPREKGSGRKLVNYEIKIATSDPFTCGDCLPDDRLGWFASAANVLLCTPQSEKAKALLRLGNREMM